MMSLPPVPRAARPAYHHGDLQNALMEAARALMAEQQSWDFSLRELARRAGVSHNAPYNHFADKRDLLAALAADGFERLAARTAAAAAAAATPQDALLAIGLAYVRFGLDNPAHYRLMFGSVFTSLAGPLPETVLHAGGSAKAVLHEAIRAGAEAGVLAPAATDEAAIEAAALAAWSLVHGLTLLFLDRLPGDRLPGGRLPGGGTAGPSAEAAIEPVLRLLMTGLLRR